MSPLISVRRRPQVEVDASPLRRMQEAARQGAVTAAVRLGPAMRHSREFAAERLLEARGWSAPRLERAAGYVERDLAPRLSAMLADTAHRLEPPKPTNRARNAALVMLGMIAAAGAAGALASRRSAAHTLGERMPEPTTTP